MMENVPFMSISDQFGPVMAIIIVECGKQWLNMGGDLSMVIVSDYVFLSNCVWRCLGLFL
jgi:hypothetical protein